MSQTYVPRNELPFDEDLRLIEGFLAGDGACFQALYERYSSKVGSIAMGILMDHDEAEDAVQVIFTNVYRNLRKFDHRSKFSTWLFRIAVNCSIQQARSARGRRRWRPIEEASDVSYTEREPEVEDTGIHRAMDQMKPRDRAILTLYYWQEMPLQDIAASLGCNENAAKTRLFRARQRFRELYEEAGE